MNLNVLVVDDSATVRNVIARTLLLSNAPLNEVYEAANGEEALAVLAERRIDLVFSDLGMPVMDGFAFVDRMAALNLLPFIPVIVVSIGAGDARMDDLRRKGVRGYVRKPFVPEAIRDTLEGVLAGGLHGSCA